MRRLGGVGPVGAVGAKRARNTSGSKAGARRAALGAAAHGGEPRWTMWNRSGRGGCGALRHPIPVQWTPGHRSPDHTFITYRVMNPPTPRRSDPLRSRDGYGYGIFSGGVAILPTRLLAGREV